MTATGTPRKQGGTGTAKGAAAGRGACIFLNRRPGGRAQGILAIAGRAVPCAIGRSGIGGLKREGDGATPAAPMRLVAVLWRPDRGPPPATRLPRFPIAAADGWSDAAFDASYNRPVRLPYRRSHEAMARADHLYDIVVVLDWNFSRRLHGRGSAIFMHLARPGLGPTEGCIALARASLLRLLATAGPGARVIVRV